MAATSRVTRSTARSSEGFVPILPPTPISPITTTRRRKRRGLSAEIDISPVNDETPDYRPASLPSKPPKRQRVRIGTPISPTPGVKADKRRLQAESEASASHNIVDPLQRINLAQDRLRHDPWKMLVMTTLLNKTAGRAARPIFTELLERYPSPTALSQAAIPDLADILYPLGLSNQRAASLIRLSSQYLSFGWPIASTDGTLPLPDGRIPLNDPLPRLQDLDVRVFYGSGTYASDSFRIYSPLLPGGGAPRDESKWLGKRERAVARLVVSREDAGRITQATRAMEADPETEVVDSQRGGTDPRCSYDVDQIGGWMSDEEEDQEDEQEWRRVVPGDKELRRYLVWRWALEGIAYDINSGPRLHRSSDRRRLVKSLPSGEEA